ncbi:MAG: hypothetical protein ACREM3_16720 [Candidatus Rokuibacteriota bacterium]
MGIAFPLALLLLVGCATAPLPQLPRDEWTALKTRSDPDVTPERILIPRPSNCFGSPIPTT